MNTERISILICSLLILLGLGIAVWQRPSNRTLVPVPAAPASFADCQDQSGSHFQESYPEVCVTSDGHSFSNPNEIAPAPPQYLSPYQGF